MEGGKAIASGGYGCVFNPALKCKETNQRYNGASKLIRNRSAYEEMEEANKIKKIIKNIPNSNKYVLLPDSMCTPYILESTDLENFDKKCKRFSDAKNNLNNYKILNMPFGGPDFSKFLETAIIDDNFITINNNLYKFIKFISNYNSKSLLHADLKGPNILINPTNFHCKIIDWGLAIIHNNKYSEVKEELEWRPLQFNIPPSNILFSDSFLTFIKKRSKYFKTYLTPEDRIKNIDSLTQELMIEYDDHYKDNYGSGHYDTHIYHIQVLNDNLGINKSNPTKSNKYYLFNYIAKVAIIFTREIDRMFDSRDYLMNVYTYNCDIWGILTAYFQFLEITRTRFKFKNKSDSTIINFRKQLSNILNQYMYLNKSPEKKINIDILIKDLKQLNLYFNKPTSVTTNNSQSLESPLKSQLKPIVSKQSKAKNPYKLTSKFFSTKKRKRCPNGTRRNRKTGKCQNINSILSSISLSSKKKKEMSKWN